MKKEHNLKKLNNKGFSLEMGYEEYLKKHKI